MRFEKHVSSIAWVLLTFRTSVSRDRHTEAVYSIHDLLLSSGSLNTLTIVGKHCRYRYNATETACKRRIDKDKSLVSWVIGLRLGVQTIGKRRPPCGSSNPLLTGSQQDLKNSCHWHELAEVKNRNLRNDPRGDLCVDSPTYFSCLMTEARATRTTTDGSARLLVTNTRLSCGRLTFCVVNFQKFKHVSFT